MRTYYSSNHLLHAPKTELSLGIPVPPFEKPERAELIRARVEAVGLGPILPPDEYDPAKFSRIHDPGMVALLQTGHAEWVAAGREGDALAYSWRATGMRDDRVPSFIDGKLSRYSFDYAAPLTATSWGAIRSSAEVALTAADALRAGEHSVFALCRPPGHHAATSQYGGYCFLNNAAIAAQHLLDCGAGKIAILDVDYHHGNGTQEIFYRRADVFFASIHGDPDFEYPFLCGWSDEIGEGAGEGSNLNLPLPAGTRWDAWSEALETACRAVAAAGPDIVIVSLGVDTFKLDPISQFKLEHEDYLRMGARIAQLGRPTLFVMEGGYAVAEIGINAVNVLEGFLA